MIFVFVGAVIFLFVCYVFCHVDAEALPDFSSWKLMLDKSA